jgi:hypothetical protein
MMYGREKSDASILPRKPTNKAGRPVAEPVERRGVAKGGGQGERTSAKHAADTGPGKRVTGAGAHTRSGNYGSGSASVAMDSLRRQIPKAGARCVRCARRDLRGGRGVTRVPTAIGIPRYFEPTLGGSTCGACRRRLSGAMAGGTAEVADGPCPPRCCARGAPASARP